MKSYSQQSGFCEGRKTGKVHSFPGPRIGIGGLLQASRLNAWYFFLLLSSSGFAFGKYTQGLLMHAPGIHRNGPGRLEVWM